MQWAVGAAAAAVLAVVVIVFAVVLPGDDEEPTRETTTVERTTRSNERGNRETEPRVTTVEVGGRPTVVAAGGGVVWVADSFAPRAAVLTSEAADANASSFRLDGAPADVATDGDGAWYALPEQQGVERREADEPAATGEVTSTDGFPAVVAATEGAVFAVSESSVETIDAATGDSRAAVELDGFATSAAAGEGYGWVVVENREVVRIDPGSGEVDGDPIEVEKAFGIATGEGAAWVVSVSGTVTRIDPESLEVTSSPKPVRGALDVAAGLGSVWVSASDTAVIRLDPDTLEPQGKPLPVGDEPSSVSVGDEAAWVTNGAEGELTRIEP